jgi:ribonuclease D
MKNIHYHLYDLPDSITLKGDLAIDTEAMGLKHDRDRLCVVQISDEEGEAHVIHFPKAVYDKSPNLCTLLADKSRVKIFHYARFDVAIIQKYLGISMNNIYCTKIASRLVRTYTDQHSLKELCSELLGVKISKQQQSSYWGSDNLSKEQIEYAASDVAHLHLLRIKLDQMLTREGRAEIAKKCFEFIPARAELDIIGWQDFDIFAHH